jgi:hypothetical protein
MIVRTARATMLVLLLSGVVGLLAWNKTSPFAQDRANTAYLAGNFEGASVIYQQIASGWLSRGTRADAAERACSLELRQGRNVQAVRWLRTAIGLSDGDEKTRRRQALATVYATRFGDFHRAAEVLRTTAAETGSVEAAVDAARYFAKSGDWQDAATAWSVALPLIEDPQLKDEAQAGLLRAERHGEDGAEGDGLEENEALDADRRISTGAP